MGQARHKVLATKNLLCFNMLVVGATVQLSKLELAELLLWETTLRPSWSGDKNHESDLWRPRASGQTYEGLKENHFKCSVYVRWWTTMSSHTHIIYNRIKVTSAQRTSTAKTALSHTHTNTRAHTHTYKHKHWHTLPRERQSERDIHIDTVYS